MEGCGSGRLIRGRWPEGRFGPPRGGAQALSRLPLDVPGAPQCLRERFVRTAGRTGMIDDDQRGRVTTAGEPDDFLGREQELGELRRLACGTRAVALTGAGGIGKTRLLRRL